MKKEIARGAAWMMLFRVADKTLGLISSVILARLLVPEDFGLIAMAMSIVALVELASAFGFESVLIQKTHPTRTHYDTAWTLNVAFGVACCVVMWALAPAAATFYGEPRLVPVILVLAAASVLQGLENVGTVQFRREMNFNREFAFLASKRFSGFAVTIVLAFALQNYWALVVGSVAGRFAGMIFSYAMHPYRPRLSLAARTELFGFSSWLLLTNVVNFAETKFAHFFIGRAQGPAALGIFSMGSDIASIASTELSSPINRAAFPGYARLQHSLPDLQSAVSGVIGTIALISVPASLGILVVAEPLIALMLGPKWVEVTPLLQILAVAFCLRALASNFHAVFYAVGRPHLTPILEATRVAILVPLTFLLASKWGLAGVAWAQLATMILGMLISVPVLCRVLHMSIWTLCQHLWRVALAGVLMAAAVTWVDGALFSRTSAGVAITALRLATDVTVGVFAYVAFLTSIWFAVGRPAGPEQNALGWLHSTFLSRVRAAR